MARPRRSLRRTLVATLLFAGLVPLVAAVVLVTTDARSSATEADRRAAGQLAASTSTELSRAFDEWAGELLVAAQNDALRGYYRDPTHRGDYQRQIDASLVGLHTVHPDLIDEACYIDAAGPERARMVRGEAVGAAELSPDESGNPFFRASFAVAEGVVHEHTPYVSPDSGTWVVASATPIVVGGRKVAILHVETELEGLRNRLRKLLPAGTTARVVDTGRHVVVLDSGTAVPRPDLKIGIDRNVLPPTAPLAVPAGYVTASADVQAGPDNANRWRVEVVTPARGDTGSALPVQIALLVVLVVVALVGASTLLTRRIVRPLQAVATRAERVAKGDLRVAPATHRDDEIGRVAHAVDGATEALRDALRDIRIRSDELADLAQGVAAVGRRLTGTAAATDEQSQAVQDLAHRVGGTSDALRAGVDSLGGAVGDISARTGEAASVAADGARIAARTNTLVGELVAASSAIDDVVQVIGAVTGQTRLLALNATIEAARAGEHGRGFAVVATEVKHLAEQTQRAADQIGERVGTLRTTAASAASAVERISETIAEVDRTQDAISDAVQRQTSLADRMRTDVGELTDGAGEMAAGSERVSSASATTRRTADEAADAAEQLEGIASGLRQLLAAFTVE